MLNCCESSAHESVGCLSHELFGSASNIRDRTTAHIRAAIHPKALSRGSDSEKDGQVLALLRPRAIIEWNEIKKEGIGLSNLAIALTVAWPTRPFYFRFLPLAAVEGTKLLNGLKQFALQVQDFAEARLPLARKSALAEFRPANLSDFFNPHRR